MSNIQSILFDRDFWDIESAADYFFDVLKLKMPKGKEIHATDRFFRFRVKTPNSDKFFYRTKKLNNHIEAIIQYPIKQLKGGSFVDVLKDPIGTIKEAFRSSPSRLNNISMRTLNEFGSEKIDSLRIARTPLSSTLVTGINILSGGQFSKVADKYYDKLYHLAVIINNSLILEKNEVVNLEPLKSSSVNSQTEYLNVPLHGRETIEQLINNTALHMGKDFLTYSAMNNNNCQDYVRAIISSNNLMTPQIDNFIYQDITPLQKELNPYVSKTIDSITNLASHASRFIGKGKINKKIEKFYQYIFEKGFKFL